MVYMTSYVARYIQELRKSCMGLKVLTHNSLVILQLNPLQPGELILKPLQPGEP
jgi:hypothetical protein